MKNPLQTFEPNTAGRDFVIGDLHGSLPCLETLLVGIQFDPTVDRMFSVGDLVDRGPNSIACLRLLLEDWFHAVLANHEQMMLEAFTDGYLGQFWLQNGGLWGIEALLLAQELGAQIEKPEHLTDEAVQVLDLLPLVEELPYLITINMPDGKKFHVIHAELPHGQLITDEDLSSPSKVREIATVPAREGEFILWGRFLFAEFRDIALNNFDKIVRTIAYKMKSKKLVPFNENLSHIISGHTIVRHPLTILGQTNIDTCAYDACTEKPPTYTALTCVNLHEWKFYQATPTEFREVNPIVVNKDDVANSKCTT